MKIQEIYDQYKIMPQLQLHQLRVASVASIICDDFSEPLDKRSIISACLLHDMGAMSKIKLDIFPEHTKKAGMDYWKKVQQNFIKKFGREEKAALHRIVEKLRLDKNVIELIRGFGFDNTPEIYKSEDPQLKICVYSDMRVSPNGVVTLQERLNEAKIRYLTVQRGIYSKTQFETNIPLWEEIEKKIFSLCKVNQKQITDKKVEPLLQSLRNYKIH